MALAGQRWNVMVGWSRAICCIRTIPSAMGLHSRLYTSHCKCYRLLLVLLSLSHHSWPVPRYDRAS